jgi:hypothetical protein
MGLHRTAFEIGALLNGKRLVVDIADDMRVGPENHLATLNRALDAAVDDHSLSSDSSGDLGSARDNERNAMNLTFYLPIDLD